MRFMKVVSKERWRGGWGKCTVRTEREKDIRMHGWNELKLIMDGEVEGSRVMKK